MSGVMGRNGSMAPSGIYRSTDRARFEHIGPHHIRMYTLTHDPREVSTLVVAAMDGVLRTRDSGRTWRTLTSWDMTEPKEVAFDPSVPDHLYAGLPDGIAFSMDRGATWVRRQAGIARAYTQTVTVDRTKAGRVLAGTELGIYLTEDAALTWKQVLPTRRTTYDLKQSPHDARVFVAATSADGAWRTDDGGGSWRRLEGVPERHTLHYCDFDLHAAKGLLVCGWEAGLLLSADGGRTWEDRSAGLPNRRVWSAAFDPDIPGRIYAAPYLAPLHASDDHGKTWRPIQWEAAIVYDLLFVPRP
jgi:photosystem II stability/assembly factor-like uncharacterized protein